MKFNANPVRGTKDYLPFEMETRQEIINIILNTYKNNGFLHVKTPILENLDLLVGGDSGDNQKLMFKTLKRGDKLNLSKPNLTEFDIAEEGLRYDLTVPLVRMFIGNKENLPVPFKSIQIDESFRAERPQRGRVRQFTQCDVDVLGDASISAEIEVLLTVMETYKNIGFEGVTLKINNRKILNEIVTGCGFNDSDFESVCISLDKLDKIFISGVREELVAKNFNEQLVDKLLLAIDDVKLNGVETLYKYNVSQELVSELLELLNVLKSNLTGNFVCEFDITVIRGQGYYTGFVFEAYVNDSRFEFRGAIGGGGRYDNMIEKLSGTKTPAVGYGIGLYPITMLMTENNIKLTDNKKIALLYTKENSLIDVFKIKKDLTKMYDVSTFLIPKNLNALLTKLKTNNFIGFVYFNDCQNETQLTKVQIREL